MSDTLLPSNATPHETALATTVARLSNVPVPLATLWNPWSCPAALLPWLAWGLSVDEWDAGWPEDKRRQTIADSLFVHRKKGTRAAVRRAIAGAGYGTAQLIENYGRRFFDATVPRNGSNDRSEPDHWAEYRVVLDRPMTNPQAAQVRRILATIAPLRSHLRALDYVRTANVHNGTVPRTGLYNRGVA